MVHSINSVNLKLDIPNSFSPVTSGGGGWPLKTDTIENWAWSKDIFNSAELDAIINIGNSLELERASTYGPYNLEIRDSFVNFIFPNEVTSWIFERLATTINTINDQFFKFDLYSMEQGLQFTRYQAPGEHYEWHVDRGMHVGMRKLSMSLQLSDPDTYEGGDLEIWYGGDPIKACRERGYATYFPSYVMHRVTPVTKGIRYSLVCWVSGPAFR